MTQVTHKQALAAVEVLKAYFLRHPIVTSYTLAWNAISNRIVKAAAKEAEDAI